MNRRKTLFPDYYHYVFVIKRFRQRGTFYRTNVIKRLIQIPSEKGSVSSKFFSKNCKSSREILHSLGGEDGIVCSRLPETGGVTIMRDYTTCVPAKCLFSGVICPAHETTRGAGGGRGGERRKNEITFCSAKCN